MSWRSDAACKDAEGINWFPEPNGPGTNARWRENLARARQVCDACPVREPCLASAMAVPFTAGIWAGTTESQRRRSPLKSRRTVQVARCGTDSGYRRHRYLGESICPACREAHAVAIRLRRHMLEVVR